jgi:hypoxanthine phosphoribosyltransferase
MNIDLNTLMIKIKEKVEDKYDYVVAIERGGILPGYLISRFLDIPLKTIKIKFRDDRHNRIYDNPVIEKRLNINLNGKNILIVDDVSNTKSTLKRAKSLFKKSKIETLVISGDADHSLFGPHDKCIEWPWE